jgi:hypothetical protein
MSTIPFGNVTKSFKLKTVLDAKTYELQFDWNSRSEQFAITIRDNDGLDLLQDVLNSNREIIRKYKNQLLPSGNLFLLEKSDLGLEPTLENLETDFELNYVDAS